MNTLAMTNYQQNEASPNNDIVTDMRCPKRFKSNCNFEAKKRASSLLIMPKGIYATQHLDANNRDACSM